MLLESANILGNAGSRGNGVTHIGKYILPYLSSDARNSTVQNFKNHFFGGRLSSVDTNSHGEKYDPNATYTHILHSKANGFPKGTPIKVTGAHLGEDGQTMFVTTENHGVIPTSKLAKPESLKTKRIGEGGYEVEGTIAKNLNSEPAGASNAYDFVHDDKVSGKVFKQEKEGEKPLIRGESKAGKTGNVSAGTGTLYHNKETGTWEFGSGGASDRFKDALRAAWTYDHEEGKPGNRIKDENGEDKKISILDYLNKHHKDGEISKGLKFNPPKRAQNDGDVGPGFHREGVVSAYMNGMGANALHLHRRDKNKGIDRGTSFTVGNNNELAGKTKLGHLTDEDLDKLDGSIEIRKGRGSARILSQMNPKTFMEHADLSENDPENHRSLYRKEHADEFMDHISDHLKSVESNPYNIQNNEEIQYKLKQFTEHIYNRELNKGIDLFEEIMNIKISEKLEEQKRNINL